MKILNPQLLFSLSLSYTALIKGRVGQTESTETLRNAMRSCVDGTIVVRKQRFQKKRLIDSFCHNR